MSRLLNAIVAGGLAASCGGEGQSSPVAVREIPAEQRLSPEELALMRCRQGASDALHARNAFLIKANVSPLSGAGYVGRATSECLRTGQMPRLPQVELLPEGFGQPFYNRLRWVN